MRPRRAKPRMLRQLSGSDWCRHSCFNEAEARKPRMQIEIDNVVGMTQLLQ